MGRALKAADHLPDATPSVRVTVETADGEWCYSTELSLLGAARVTAVLEAAEVVKHPRPAAPTTRPQLRLLRTP